MLDRQNRLLNAGVRLLRFTGADVLRNQESVVVQVTSALKRSFLAGSPLRV
jgi:very-short-patch-repair endonuclease